MAKKKAQTKSVKTHALDTPKYLDVHKKKAGMAYRFVKKTAQDIGRWLSATLYFASVKSGNPVIRLRIACRDKSALAVVSAEHSR